MGGAKVFSFEPNRIPNLVGEGFGGRGPLAMGNMLGSDDVGAEFGEKGKVIGDRGDG
jgi:hypothetical protein